MEEPQARFGEFHGAGVIVTGGASGIGAALVEGFSAQGARVGIIDFDGQAATALCRRIADMGLTAPVHVQVDLRDVASIAPAVNALAAALGGIKVLINNAGWDDRHAFDAVTVDYWDSNQAINLRPVFFVTQAASVHLRQAKGASVINFSSIAYMMNMPNMASYVSAKAGIIGLTKGLAGELGRDGIRVNALLPGMVLTERQKKLWVTDESARLHRARQCLDMTLTEADMVGPCLFLASDGARAMTGQSLVIDGGYF